jgi:hypothetical protein
MLRIRIKSEYWLLGTTALIATGNKKFHNFFYLLISQDGGDEYLLTYPISLINMASIRVDIFWDQKIIPRIRIRRYNRKSRETPDLISFEWRTTQKCKYYHLFPQIARFKTRAADPNKIQSGQWIRIRIRNPDPASSVTWTYYMEA